ncbi:MAG: sulfur oxidation c-type cytochrome SoxX [Neomegalonema sp.]|nr:sulfur oxidation c-type cytochrome SoxX [Neomegalonema sp.]
MKTSILAIAATMLATGALAEPVAPSAVSFNDGAVATSLSGQPGDATRGREIVGTKSLGNCVSCHAITEMSDVPWHGEVGPTLDGVADRWDEAQLRGIVANAKMTYDGTIMPAFYKVSGFTRPGDGYTGKAAKEISPVLDAQQIEDVVAYLMTLKEE